MGKRYLWPTICSGNGPNIKPSLARKRMNYFCASRPALMVTDSIAYSKKPLVLPDNNRVYARKAQFQFGWDWGPASSMRGSGNPSGSMPTRKYPAGKNCRTSETRLIVTERTKSALSGRRIASVQLFILDGMISPCMPKA